MALDYCSTIKKLIIMNSQLATTGGSLSRPSKTFKSNSFDQSRSGDSSKAMRTEASRREVVFQFDDKSAGEVLLAGNFTNWSDAPIRMHREGGSWQTKVLLAPGRYSYKFLVDGDWKDDPRAAEDCPNPFGTSDSIRVIS